MGEEPIWAVCLYDEIDGTHIIEFVRGDNREDAEVQAIGLNETDNSSWSVTAAAQMPEGV